MTAHLMEAYRVDIETRTNPEENQRTFPTVQSERTRVPAGVVYKDANVTVTAFATQHAMETTAIASRRRIAAS